MAGSWDSGDELEAGKINYAFDWTQIWARRTDSSDGDDFNGDAILIVREAQNLQGEDPGDFLDGDYHPQHTINGIMAWGYSAAQRGDAGGIGVIGNGGTNQGTGVLGIGNGNIGMGGIGVHGIGGSQTEPPVATAPPGTGVLGQGGRQTSFNTLRLPHAAGVVGLAGGHGKPIPPLEDTGSVGVYGQGAEMEVDSIDMGEINERGDPKLTDVGPRSPGPGVLGRGGVEVPEALAGQAAAGVIGLAGGTTIPPFIKTVGNGVYGEGNISGISGKSKQGTGVAGYSDAAHGVYGESAGQFGVYGFGSTVTARGGAFYARHSAQILLVPHMQKIVYPAPVSVSPKEISTKEKGPLLPKDGHGGDLLCISDSTGECTLWFCVKSSDESAVASWSQVLLGTRLNGQA